MSEEPSCDYGFATFATRPTSQGQHSGGHEFHDDDRVMVSYLVYKSRILNRLSTKHELYIARTLKTVSGKNVIIIYWWLRLTKAVCAASANACSRSSFSSCIDIMWGQNIGRLEDESSSGEKCVRHCAVTQLSRLPSVRASEPLDQLMNKFEK